MFACVIPLLFQAKSTSCYLKISVKLLTVSVLGAYVNLHTYFWAYRLRAAEEHQYCTFQTVAIPITRIANPMQAINFPAVMYKNYIPPVDSRYFSTGASPIFYPPSTLTLTPPPSTGRGRKGRGRSKLTVPKPTAPDNSFGLHTPPESPEDCLDIRCRHGDNVETPRSLSDADDDAEEEEMQDYRYRRFTTPCNSKSVKHRTTITE